MNNHGKTSRQNLTIRTDAHLSSIRLLLLPIPKLLLRVPPIERDSPRTILCRRIIVLNIASDYCFCIGRYIPLPTFLLFVGEVHITLGVRFIIAFQRDVAVKLLIEHEPRNMLRLEAIFLNGVIVLDARRRVKVIDPSRMVTSIDGNGTLDMCVVNVAQDA